MIQYHWLTEKTLLKFQQALERFEKAFTYPLGDRHFFISHGSDYGAFFRSLGSAEYLIVQKEKDVIGSLAFIKQKITHNHQIYNALYFADFKVTKEYQRKGISKRIVRGALWHYIRNPFDYLLSTTFIYFIAMQKNKGDFTKIKSTWSPLRLFSSHILFHIIMVPPSLLSNMIIDTVDEKIDAMVNLSPNLSDSLSLISDQSGKKNLIVDGKPLRIAHIHLGESTNENLLELLKKGGLTAHNDYDVCCFALDSRRQSVLNYLEKQGISSSALAKMYHLALSPTLSQALASSIVTINTARI